MLTRKAGICHAVLVSAPLSGERYECYTSARTDAALVQPRKQPVQLVQEVRMMSGGGCLYVSCPWGLPIIQRGPYSCLQVRHEWPHDVCTRPIAVRRAVRIQVLSRKSQQSLSCLKQL